MTELKKEARRAFLVKHGKSSGSNYYAASFMTAKVRVPDAKPDKDNQIVNDGCWFGCMFGCEGCGETCDKGCSAACSKGCGNECSLCSSACSSDCGYQQY